MKLVEHCTVLLLASAFAAWLYGLEKSHDSGDGDDESSHSLSPMVYLLSVSGLFAASRIRVLPPSAEITLLTGIVPRSFAQPSHTHLMSGKVWV
jgi:hypothetical protein